MDGDGGGDGRARSPLAEAQYRADARVTIDDMTNAYAVLGVMGPNSRALLQPLCENDLGNEAFPFGALARDHHRQRPAPRHPHQLYGRAGLGALCAQRIRHRRVRYCCWPMARAHGLKLCGMHAMDSLRIEKAYRHWGHDITDEDTPLEAGLGFAVAFDKNADFHRPRRAAAPAGGKRSCPSACCSSPSRTRSRCSITTSRSIATASWWAHTSSANYGHHLGRAIAMGYVRNEGGVDADLRRRRQMGNRSRPEALRRAKASLRPLYDPTSARMKV